MLCSHISPTKNPFVVYPTFFNDFDNKEILDVKLVPQQRNIYSLHKSRVVSLILVIEQQHSDSPLYFVQKKKNDFKHCEIQKQSRGTCSVHILSKEAF